MGTTMMRSTSRKLTAAAALLLVSAGVIVGPKVSRLAADPVGEKDCPPTGVNGAAETTAAPT
jgi:hypothetical protein